MSKIQACFFIPVCAADKQRLCWTIESIKKFCSDYVIYVLVDGVKSDFEHGFQDYEGCVVIFIDKPTNRHWGLIWRMQNNGMREALKRDDLDDECVFIKIDADAVITRHGFIEKSQKFFRENPSCGQAGQVFTNIIGLPLENKGWKNYFEARVKPMGMLKLFARYILEGCGPLKSAVLSIRFKNILKKARRNGYIDGSFAIGGSYMLRKSVIEKMEKNDLLLNSPFCFIPDVGEDVLMTPHVYYVGYEVADHVGKDGLFAIYGEELIVNPTKLKKSGNYIVHPLKYGYTKEAPTYSEEELVRFFISS